MTDLNTYKNAASAVPVGAIIPYGSSSAPTGFLACDGSLVNIATYPSLYAVVGVVYGGDGVTTFGLPNLSGLIPRGTGAQTYNSVAYSATHAARAADKTHSTGLSASALSSTNVSAVSTANTDHTHTHTDNFYSQTFSSSAGSNALESSTVFTSPFAFPQVANGDPNTRSKTRTLSSSGAISHNHTPISASTTVTSAMTGDTVTRPFAVTVNYLIKA